MNEKLEKMRNICNCVGAVALLMYIVMTFGGNESIFLLMRIFTATVALIAYAIKFGVELINNVKFNQSLILMTMATTDIVLSAIQLAN